MVTKAQIKEYLKHKLATNPAWALKALTVVAAKQTASEFAVGSTHDLNGVGFGGCDAEILTSFAKQYAQRNTLSPKQMAIVFKKMPRYWGQVLPLIQGEKLDKLKTEAGAWTGAVQTNLVLPVSTEQHMQALAQ